LSPAARKSRDWRASARWSGWVDGAKSAASSHSRRNPSPRPAGSPVAELVGFEKEEKNQLNWI
jgi:hypothetical protein